MVSLWFFSIFGPKSAFTSKLLIESLKNWHDKWLMGDKESYVSRWLVFIVSFEDEDIQDCLFLYLASRNIVRTLLAIYKTFRLI